MHGGINEERAVPKNCRSEEISTQGKDEIPNKRSISTNRK
jgi:hypothetical protein